MVVLDLQPQPKGTNTAHFFTHQARSISQVRAMFTGNIPRGTIALCQFRDNVLIATVFSDDSVSSNRCVHSSGPVSHDHALCAFCANRAHVACRRRD